MTKVFISYSRKDKAFAGWNLTATEALLYLNDAKYNEHPACPEYPVSG